MARVSAQLRLFPLARPLVERLGNDFFKSAPRSPGVYIMRGAQERILYIGQSKNLRLRLAFYKNANPDRIPRRLTRLVHQVETIALECCPSAIAARTRELELLRIHSPRFNRADTGPRHFHYVERSSDGIALRFDAPTTPDEESAWIGPIQGRMVPFEAFAALHRLKICSDREIRRCEQLPIFPKRLSTIQIDFCNELESFLSGESADLVTTLLRRQPPDAELALRQMHECDAEALLAWFRLLQQV